jgi:uncharacterized protein (DUF302 family)
MYIPEAASSCPLKLVIYAVEERKTIVAYDSFVSLLGQYRREEINQIVWLVEQRLEVLAAAVTT